MQTYIFDNAGRQAPARLNMLSTFYDDVSKRHLDAVGLMEGWRCLEVGAGQGSIAAWLSERVGRNGLIVATDIDARLLDRLKRPNVSVLCHDISSDPLPREAFDLVHTRLVLMHVRNRSRALDTLTASLRRGGWFVGEEFDALSTLADPSVNASEVPLKTGAAMRRLMTERGADLRYGRSLADRLRAQGFVDITAEGTISMWRGGSPGADFIRASYEQVAEPMLQFGYITERDLNADLARLNDPTVVVPSPILWSVRARRPPFPN